jgi:hypothetical protein
MYYELLDYETGESLGIVKPIGEQPFIDIDGVKEELQKSWADFNKLEEHELDNQSVDDFVEWHNENWESQIERVFLTQIIPQ